MCLAIPGKIIEIENNIAKIQYPTLTSAAKIVRGDYEIGDYVIVQGRIVIEKIPIDQVEAWNELISNKE